ncbi:glycosyltransferase family 2 protein [Spongiibacter nanhainus]|uniref:Glycosyltransferase family 2 protein n=1 Tax=Spongiibacter nanhainus TaxID=2794344 RepID=A0A7T4R2U9_9GAMM|nr:glycosyltransferase family 2 protein [Spongiibacter nanhainus]QQD19435.1 glycosyltransferase family 2 protein [Spongiibacter nanhainus]
MGLTLSVIIVNYNGGEYLKRAVDSLSLLTVDYEIVVVDNNSTDNSLSVLPLRSNLKIIKNEKNVGFGVANNLGVMKCSGDVILLMNNDAALLEDIGSFVKLVRRDKKTVWSCSMVGEDKKVRPSFGRFPSSFLDILLPSRLYSGEGADESSCVDWIEGSLMLTSRVLWERVGGFDENIFMYGEDIILCKEMKEVGAKFVVDPDVKYFHRGGFDESKKGNIYIGFKSYFSKYYSGVRRKYYLTLISAVVFLKYSLGVLFKNRTAADSYRKAM